MEIDRLSFFEEKHAACTNSEARKKEKKPWNSKMLQDGQTDGLLDRPTQQGVESRVRD